MNNLGYVFQIIGVGLAIATFLLNTGRGVKAIEVCKECLIFVNNVVPKSKEEQLFKLVSCAAIYETLIMAYCLISDDTNAIEYSMQRLEICKELKKTGEYKEILVVIYLGVPTHYPNLSPTQKSNTKIQRKNPKSEHKI